jgi:hypothetical protein
MLLKDIQRYLSLSTKVDEKALAYEVSPFNVKVSIVESPIDAM